MSDVILVPGINIQYPWSRLLLSGRKTIETRTYAIPQKHLCKPLALIETPGLVGDFSAQIVGLISFKKVIKYSTKMDFESAYLSHLVSSDDASFGWKESAEKWGWIVDYCTLLNEPQSAPRKRGIVFSSNCAIPASALDPKVLAKLDFNFAEVSMEHKDLSPDA